MADEKPVEVKAADTTSGGPANQKVIVKTVWPTNTLTIEDKTFDRKGVEMSRSEAEKLVEKVSKNKRVYSSLVIEDVK